MSAPDLCTRCKWSGGHNGRGLACFQPQPAVLLTEPEPWCKGLRFVASKPFTWPPERKRATSP